MIFKNRFIKSLSEADIVVICFYIFLIALNLIFHQRIENWFLLIAVNIILIIAVFFLANTAEKSNNVYLNNFHFYYV
ncbi:MAG: hypothetical protein KDC90_02275, partial [Ignavibacteriae bacterium]|nr:hypothetical protein [Ignavibacteriota bacterium]